MNQFSEGVFLMSSFQPQKAVRILFAVFSSIFGFVGIAVLCFLWGAPFGDFHSPPLFFRVFGSFIALAFIVFSTLMVISTLSMGSVHNKVHQIFDSMKKKRYRCPSCGAALENEADVSPSGDAKCQYCQNWFNVAN